MPTDGRPSDVTIPEMWYPGVQNYWSRCTSQPNVGDHIQGVRAVVIHATAGSRSSGAVSVNNSSPATSFHWLVPDGNEPQHRQIAWSCVRERDAAWHVRNDNHHPQVNNNRTQVNHWSLGIEIVIEQSGDSFSDWQVAVTAQIVRYCWAKYPNLRHIVSYARLDPTRRVDPGANFPWKRFRNLILNADVHPLELLPVSNIAEVEKNLLDKFETASEVNSQIFVLKSKNGRAYLNTFRKIRLNFKVWKTTILLTIKFARFFQRFSVIKIITFLELVPPN